MRKGRTVTFEIITQLDPVNGTFTARVPQIKGLLTSGNTREEAIFNAEKKIAQHLGSMEIHQSTDPKENAH